MKCDMLLSQQQQSIVYEYVRTHQRGIQALELERHSLYIDMINTIKTATIINSLYQETIVRIQTLFSSILLLVPSQCSHPSPHSSLPDDLKRVDQNIESVQIIKCHALDKLLLPLRGLDHFE